MNNNAKLYKIFAFAILSSVIYTTLLYRAGIVDQIEQLPLIMRSLDPNYLTHDFFVNSATQGITPRLSYQYFVALLAHLFPLPTVLYGLTIGSNIAVAIMTGLLSWTIKKSLFCAILSIFTNMFIFVPLGGSRMVYSLFLVPSTIAIPLLMGATLLILYKHDYLALLPVTVAAILHPLIGIVGGMLIFAALYGTRPLKTLILPFVYLGTLGLIWYIAGSTERIDDSLFIEILASYRHPHHYLPSHFNLNDWILFGLILFLGGIGTYFLGDTLTWWRKRWFINLAILMLVMMLVGYVFVEIIPLRIIVTLQLYRFHWLLDWCAIILSICGVSYALDFRSNRYRTRHRSNEHPHRVEHGN